MKLHSLVGRRQFPEISRSIRGEGQPESRGIQEATEDPHRQTKGSRGPRRVRREDGQEIAKGSRQARRYDFCFVWCCRRY